MLAESARAASAAEARFRLQAPNSRQRATTVIALDASSESLLRRLAGDSWNKATFLKTPVADPDDDEGGDGWMTDLAEHRTRVRI